MRILLIDDDVTQKNFVEQALPSGTEIVYASTLEGGMSYLDDHQCDLVLLDIILPNVWNEEGFRKLRGFHSEVPILGFTVIRDHQFAASLIRDGMVGIYFKPHSAIELEVAQELLRLAVMEAIAHWDHRQKQAQSISAMPGIVSEFRQELRRIVIEMREIRDLVMREVERNDNLEEVIRAIQRRHEVEDIAQHQKALEAARGFAERQAAREKRWWDLMIKVLGFIAPVLIGAWNWERIKNWWINWLK